MKIKREELVQTFKPYRIDITVESAEDEETMVVLRKLVTRHTNDTGVLAFVNTLYSNTSRSL